MTKVSNKKIPKKGEGLGYDNDNWPLSPPLSLEEMREDLERAAYLDLIPQIMKNHPGVTEAEAIEHLHSFY